LTPEQREDRVTSFKDIIAMADGDKFIFNKITTGNETWCFAFDPKTKRQSSEWVGETSPRPKKLIFQRSHIKTMLIIFSTLQVIAHKEFIPEGKTIIAELYKGIMDHLLKRIQRVRPATFCSQDFLFLCLPVLIPQKSYNASSPPYFPVLSPPDRAKACIYANGAYFELKKKGMCLPYMSSIFKKISP